MAKHDYVEAPKTMFALSHQKEAEHVVFDLKRGIMFEECKEGIKGRIIVSPESGGASFKCLVFPIWSKRAKTITAHCQRRADFVGTFMEVAGKTIAKMEEVKASAKVKKSIK